MPRPLKVDDDTLRTLEQRLAKAKNDLARARAAQEDQARRLDARRKIIAGAIALEHFEKDAGSEWGKIYFIMIPVMILGVMMMLVLLPDNVLVWHHEHERDEPPAVETKGHH